MSTYTKKNLLEAHDQAPDFGMGEIGQAIFPRDELEATTTGLALHRMKPDKRQAFGHKHDQAEEIFLVLSGSGRVKLDDEVVELATMDAVRVAPEVWRAFEAGPDGMELLAFGPRHEKDGDLDREFWPADA